VPAVAEPALEDRAGAFTRAVLARDGTRARAIVESALAAGASVPDIYVGILQPCLYEVGHRWACDEVSVAGEHFATVLAESIVGALGPRIRERPRDGRLAVVAATPEERHVVGLRMVSDLLQGDGWEVLDLGAATPCEALVELVADERPDVVALSTSTAGRLPGIADLLAQLHALEPRPIIVVGGQIWTEEAARLGLELGADLIVRDARALPAVLAGHVRRDTADD